MWLHFWTSFHTAQMVKRLPTMWETQVQSLAWEDPLEKEMAIHSSTIAWKIPWTGSLVGYSPWRRKESDMTEQLHFTFHTYYIEWSSQYPMRWTWQVMVPIGKKKNEENKTQKVQISHNSVIVLRWKHRPPGVCCHNDKLDLEEPTCSKRTETSKK